MSVEPRNERELEMRHYRSGDDAAITELFRRVFNRPLTEEEWRWKLKTLPTPAETVFLITHGGRPVFQYAGIPVEVSTPYGRYTAMVSVDTMTDPDFRRRGLLTRGAKFAYRHWAEAGIPYAFGIDNDSWGSRHEALGWLPICKLSCLIRPLRLGALINRRVKNRLAATLVPNRTISFLHDAVWTAVTPNDRSLEIRTVERADAAFDRLWEACSPERPVSVVKNAAWVNWRFLDAPNTRHRVLAAWRHGQLAGYAAYRRPIDAGESIAYLSEVLVKDRDTHALGALVRSVCRHATKEGATKLQTLAIEGSPLAARFRRLGFWFAPPKSALRVLVLPLREDIAPVMKIHESNWRFMGADFDVH
jgi:hypothetical protein